METKRTEYVVMYWDHGWNKWKDHLSFDSLSSARAEYHTVLRETVTLRLKIVRREITEYEEEE